MDWIFKIFETQFLLGFIFFISGLITLKFPAKTINEMYGYRTKNSMSSIEKWNFSQRYSSILISKIGIFLICCSFLGIFFEISGDLHFWVGIVSAVFTAVFLYCMTENKLKKEFP
ncbi:MAG: SdpI family protein [Flavobacterium sp.]|nr:SdpI family protein [Flavobacterium sp.]